MWYNYDTLPLVKIILATPAYPPEVSDAALYTKELATRLRDAHEVTIVAYASTSEEVVGTNLSTASKRRPLLLRLLKYTLLLFKESRGLDVLYAHNSLATGLPAVLVSKFRGIPLVITFVGDEAWLRARQEKRTTKNLRAFFTNPEGGWRTFVRMRLQGFVLRQADMVMMPSHHLSKMLIAEYRVSPKRTIVNYEPPRRPEKIPFTAQKVPHTILTTSRSLEGEGIDDIIYAMAELVNEFPDVKLLVAGDAQEEDQLHQLVKELNLEKHVAFLGRVSRAETWYVRTCAEVYVLSTATEGIPYSVLTSFSAQVPVIASNTPVIHEVVTDGVSGLLVPIHDRGAMAHALAQIFRDVSLRTRLIQGGGDVLRDKFSWETHLTTLLSVLESVRTKPRN
jgi:glycosyltransferase involved in cell wall biosynthesis